MAVPVYIFVANHHYMSLLQKLAEEASQDAAENVNQQPDNVQPSEDAADGNESAAAENSSDDTNENTASEDNTSGEENTTTENSTEEPAPKKSLFANEELQRFNDFVIRTGKSWEDFQELNKPTSELKPEELLKKYYSEKEGMTEKEIAYELNKLVVDEDDLDFDFEDESERLKREVELERELKKAREWREQYVSEFNQPLDGSQVRSPLTIEEYQEQMLENQKKSVAEYRETVYAELADAKPAKLEYNGEQFDFVPDEEYSKNLKAVAEDFGIATNEYFDSNGKLTNVEGWLELVSWAHKPTREAKLRHYAEQVAAKKFGERSDAKRNVQPDNYQAPVTTNTTDSDDDFHKWRRERKSNNPFG